MADKNPKKDDGEAGQEGERKPARRATDKPQDPPSDEPLPSLRQVKAEPVKMAADGKSGEGGEEEQMVILLQDPEGFAPSPAVLSPVAFALASLFDGQRTAQDVAEVFEAQYGKRVDPEQIMLLVQELDQALFLDTPRFESTVRQKMVRYLSNRVRPAIHAGQSYPEDPEELQKKIEGFFTLDKAPGALPKPNGSVPDRIRGMVLPHIDLNVGGATYAHGYKALLEGSQADLFVVLGVAHHGPGDGLYNVSTKDFATPAGPVKTARGIAERLQMASGVETVLAELTHQNEHSVEFQAVLLAALLGQHAGRSFEIVPVLCGASEPFIETDRNPANDETFQRFVEALGEELDKSNRKWCILSSVDFSHVGPKFGDSTTLTDRLLLPVARADMRMLKRIESLDPDAFYFEIARTKNSRHVDAVMAVLTMLAVGRKTFSKGALLHYDQMLETATRSAVSFASLSLE